MGESEPSPLYDYFGLVPGARAASVQQLVLLKVIL